MKKAEEDQKIELKNWRDRIIEYAGNDPLKCKDCKVEMELIFVCYYPDREWLKRIGIGEWDRIPVEQINIENGTG